MDQTQRGRATKWRFAALVVAAIAVSTQWRTFVAALGRFGQLRPAWLATALAAEVASFILAAELQHQLLRAAGVRVGRGFLVALTYAGAAVSRSLPAGAAVSVGYTYRRLLRHGVSASSATWTLVVSGIVSLSMLVVVGVAGAQLRGIGLLCSAVGAVAAAVVLAGVTGTIASLAWSGRRIACLERIANTLLRLVDRALGVLGRHPWSRPNVAASEPIEVGIWQWLRACGLSAGNWLADVVAIAMTFLAVGSGAPWSRLLWAYVVIQLVVSIPVLGCIGVAESSMTFALIGIGVRPAPALAVVLVYRLLSFWLVLPLGWVASRYLARGESGGLQRDVALPPDAHLVPPLAV